jgi:hypothetical protein
MNKEIIQFIIKRLESLSGKFPSLTIKYGFDKMAVQHLVEVGPKELVDSLPFIEADIEVQNALIEFYPSEDLLIYHDEPCINIDRVVFEKKSAIQVPNEYVTQVYQPGNIQFIQSSNNSGYHCYSSMVLRELYKPELEKIFGRNNIEYKSKFKRAINNSFENHNGIDNNENALAA